MSECEKQSIYSLGGHILNSIKLGRTWCPACYDGCETENPLSEVFCKNLPADFVIQNDFNGIEMKYPSAEVCKMLLYVECKIQELEQTGNFHE